MTVLLLIAAISAVGSELPGPEYVLEYPGLAFEVLPSVMAPPVEGILGEEAGAITGDPGTSGVEYYLYYWKENLAENSRKDFWLSERFRDTVSPDLLSSLLISQVNWMEGSTASSRRETSSIGLVPVLNFNQIDDGGNVIRRGRACAIFTGEYSVLLYAMAPGTTGNSIIEEFDGVVSGMYVAGE